MSLNKNKIYKNSLRANPLAWDNLNLAFGQVGEKKLRQRLLKKTLKNT